MPYLKIRDVNLHYRVFGSQGPWLALITGGRRGFNEFVPLAEKIAAHGVRVCCTTGATPGPRTS